MNIPVIEITAEYVGKLQYRVAAMIPSGGDLFYEKLLSWEEARVMISRVEECQCIDPKNWITSQPVRH